MNIKKHYNTLCEGPFLFTVSPECMLLSGHASLLQLSQGTLEWKLHVTKHYISQAMRDTMFASLATLLVAGWRQSLLN